MYVYVIPGLDYYVPVITVGAHACNHSLTAAFIAVAVQTKTLTVQSVANKLDAHNPSTCNAK